MPKRSLQGNLQAEERVAQSRHSKEQKKNYSGSNYKLTA